jgi:formyltetrahydrofolate hydrolase
MMLTLDTKGRLAVYTSTGSIPLEVDCLDDVHRVIEKYEIDFISPAMNEAHKHTSDERLLDILDQFQLQRSCVLVAASLLKQLPRA